MSPPLFNWPPFRLVGLDADTGKPVDPNIGMKVRREFYDVKKNKDGQKRIIAHKRTGEDSKDSKVQTEDAKKNDSAKNGTGAKGEGGDKGKDAGEKKSGGNNEHGKKNDQEWTAEQDAKIKALHAEGKTLAAIGQELGGIAKKRVGARARELGLVLDKKGGGQGANNAAAKPDGGDKTADNNENAKGGANQTGGKQNKKDKMEAAKAPSKAPSKAGSKSGDGEARFTMGEWMTLQEDDLFSFGELQCLSELIMRDDQQRWLRIASAFGDKTGRHVHPEDIREKFEQMG